MQQVKFDEEFKGITMETIIDFWKEKDDIPLNILEFINNTQNKRV